MEKVLEIIRESLKFLALLFGRFDWWKDVEEALAIAIIAAEAVGDEGKEKRKEVVEMVFKYLEDRNVKLPIPDWLFKLLLGFVIDLLISYLNKKFGKGWIASLAKEEGIEVVSVKKEQLEITS